MPHGWQVITGNGRGTTELEELSDPRVWLTAASPTLSVIVPFYRVEEYIGPCLRSIAAQSLSDFEAILVDDGSTDSSLDIARSFAEGDSRFTVVRQTNAGLGPARNTGVHHSSGRYLTFVDSDDLVPRRAYESMVNALEETGRISLVEMFGGSQPLV